METWCAAYGLLSAGLQMEPQREDLVVPMAELLITRGDAEAASKLLSPLEAEGGETVRVFLARARSMIGETEKAIETLKPLAGAAGRISGLTTGPGTGL